MVSLSPLLASGVGAAQDVDYEADVAFALDAIEREAGELLRIKDVDWKAVRKEMGKASKRVETPEQHFELLQRLLARARDGHAGVRKTVKTEDLAWPTFGRGEMTGCGLFLFESKKKVYVRSTWNAAKAVGLASGMEVLKIDGVAAGKWIDQRVEYWSDFYSFSTDQHARFYVCHAGLKSEPDTRLKIDYKDLDGKKRKRTITYGKAATGAWGPALFPKGLEGTDDLSYGILESGYGYLHVRRCKSSVVDQLDQALPKLADAPGLVLDFRANSGGGFDHAGFLGRFVPKGESLRFASTIPSAGPVVYGGPIVVIVNGMTVSAGETGSGQFKEEGRAYVIGESPTAGMSSQKTTIELPSGLFSLYFSTRSNKAWFNKGRGLEGVGLIPHEIVDLDPDDLAQGVDTLIRRAQELLADFPAKQVKYDPADFGWEG